jgi:predicted transcriptional regulator
MTKNKYEIELDDKLDELLFLMAQVKRTTQSEIIRRSIALYSYLNMEEETGSFVFVENEKSNIKRKILINEM